MIITREYKNKKVAITWLKESYKVMVDFFIDGKKLETAYFPKREFDELLKVLEKYDRCELPKNLENIASELERFLPSLSADREPISVKYWYITGEIILD